MIRVAMTLKHLDVLDDVLDLVPLLPDEHTRGIDMHTVISLQEIVFNKQEDRKPTKRKE